MFFRIRVLKRFAVSVLETLFQGTLSDLRQFLATESPLKILKNTFYLTSKALFVLKIVFVLTFW